jgi:hypothetical protein
MGLAPGMGCLGRKVLASALLVEIRSLLMLPRQESSKCCSSLARTGDDLTG